MQITSILKETCRILDSTKVPIEEARPKWTAGSPVYERGLYEELRNRRRELQHLFAAITAPHQWDCKCTASHNVLLRLDPQSEQSQRPRKFRITIPSATNDGNRPAAHSLRSFELRVSAQTEQYEQSPKQCFLCRFSCTCEMHPRRDSLTQQLPFRPMSSAQRKGDRGSTNMKLPAAADKISIERGLRGHTSPSSEHATAPVSEKSIGLCAFFSHSTQGDGMTSEQEYKTCLTLPGGLFRSSYVVYNTEFRYPSARAMTLQYTRCSIGYYNRWDEFMQDCDLSLGSRLQIAATLVSNVFQLQGTWLPSDWTHRDIIIPLDSNEKQPLLTEMQAIMSIAPTNLPKYVRILNELNEAFPRYMAQVLSSDDPWCLRQNLSHVMIRPLKSLGEALCLIMLGPSSLAAMSESSDQFATELSKLYSISGERVADAVRECLVGSCATTQEDFDDDAFGQKVFDKIISPIVDACRTFFDKTSPVPRTGSQTTTAARAQLDQSAQHGHAYGTASLRDNSRAIMGNVYGNVYYTFASDLRNYYDTMHPEPLQSDSIG